MTESGGKGLLAVMIGIDPSHEDELTRSTFPSA